MQAKAKQNPERNSLAAIDQRLTEIALTSLFAALSSEQLVDHLSYSKKYDLRHAQRAIQKAMSTGDKQQQKDAINKARKALGFAQKLP